MFVLGTAAGALVVGVPTDIIDTPLFTRMTPVRWWDYPLWLSTSALTGALLATYSQRRSCTARTCGGTLLSVFAVGCPICNKIVVALLGLSGALTYFAPLQPLIGFAAVGLLAATLAQRLGVRLPPHPPAEARRSRRAGPCRADPRRLVPRFRDRHDLNERTGVRRVDHVAATDVHPHMAELVVEDEVADLQ